MKRRARAKKAEAEIERDRQWRELDRFIGMVRAVAIAGPEPHGHDPAVDRERAFIRRLCAHALPLLERTRATVTQASLCSAITVTVITVAVAIAMQTDCNMYSQDPGAEVTDDTRLETWRVTSLLTDALPALAAMPSPRAVTLAIRQLLRAPATEPSPSSFGDTLRSAVKAMLLP